MYDMNVVAYADPMQNYHLCSSALQRVFVIIVLVLQPATVFVISSRSRQLFLARKL